MSDNQIGILLRVLPESQDRAIQAIERLATVVTGLAIDGMFCELTVTPYDPEEDTSDDD